MSFACKNLVKLRDSWEKSEIEKDFNSWNYKAIFGNQSDKVKSWRHKLRSCLEIRAFMGIFLQSRNSSFLQSKTARTFWLMNHSNRLDFVEPDNNRIDSSPSPDRDRGSVFSQIDMFSLAMGCVTNLTSNKTDSKSSLYQLPKLLRFSQEEDDFINELVPISVIKPHI